MTGRLGHGDAVAQGCELADTATRSSLEESSGTRRNWAYITGNTATNGQEKAAMLDELSPARRLYMLIGNIATHLFRSGGVGYVRLAKPFQRDYKDNISLKLHTESFHNPLSDSIK
jgi:hypothetical protein